MKDYLKILSENIEVSDIQMEIIKTTYEYAFKMGVIEGGTYIVGENIAEELFKIHKSKLK